MKKIILSVTLSLLPLLTFCQATITNNSFSELIKNLTSQGLSVEQIQNTLNGIIKDPELYNELWGNFIDNARDGDTGKWEILKDLDLQFKTFQTPDNPNTSLGFDYDFNYDSAKFTEHKNKRISSDIGISLKGNVAFKKEFNPNDFLEAKVHFKYTCFSGGVVTEKNPAILSELNALNVKLAGITDMKSKEAIELLEQFGKKMNMSDQYYYSLSPKFALESNQDFSKKQYTPGLTIGLGAKGWNNDSTLSHLNLFDYPFALVRYILGTDNKLTVYGSTLPTAQFTFDYVTPVNDDIRESLVGNKKAYPRIKLETGFRTFITRLNTENVFFNANYRYYQEINAPEVIKNADLSLFSYFVMALQSTSGFYVSYANGKLPFDAKSDEVYSLGFNYKFE